MQTLITADAIATRVQELAADIRRDHPTGVHLIGVLKGAYVFMADLTRAIGGDASIDFIAVSSYGSGMTSSGQVRLLKDLDSSIEGRDVVIVEDIVDTGLTLTYLQDVLRARAPRRIRTACLLSKPTRRRVNVVVDYVGFAIEDQFVVGYGLDYNERYRGFSSFAFDPHLDLRAETLGAWAWARSRPELRRHVENYFVARREDGGEAGALPIAAAG